MLGYAVASPEDLEKERGGLKDVVLTVRLEKALRRINPWVSEEHIKKAVRAITHVPAASLMEANERFIRRWFMGYPWKRTGRRGVKAAMCFTLISTVQPIMSWW